MTITAKKSILVIGATGNTGLAVLRQLAKQPSNPAIHVLCRDTAKLSQNLPSIVELASVIKGNARNEYDIEQAVKESQADWVVVCVGNGVNVGKNDIRAVNAEATVSVLKQPQFQHVRALVVSSTGAGNSKIIVGLGIGALISHHLRHVLADHTRQEAIFAAIQDRTTIVRATALTDDKPTGKLATFGDKVKSPSIQTDRADLAAWIAHEIDMPKGGIVNVTSVKH